MSLGEIIILSLFAPISILLAILYVWLVLKVLNLRLKVKLIFFVKPETLIEGKFFFKEEIKKGPTIYRYGIAVDLTARTDLYSADEEDSVTRIRRESKDLYFLEKEEYDYDFAAKGSQILTTVDRKRQIETAQHKNFVLERTNFYDYENDLYKSLNFQPEKSTNSDTEAKSQKSYYLEIDFNSCTMNHIRYPSVYN